MLPKNGTQKFVLAIIFVSAYFSLYYMNSLSGLISEKQNKTNVVSEGSTIKRQNDWDILSMPKFDPESIIPEPGNLSLEERNDILRIINISNVEQKVYNSETFGPLTNDTFVVVIQVHFRFEYLKLLVHSLAGAEGINNSLIIFSHDVYSPKMNKAIQQIDFARVLQIFLPFSRQTTPELYPGSAEWSGHSKIVSYTLAKQHWWWKANFVFKKLEVLKNHEGVIHFLEEDDYVVPDYITVMKKLEVLMMENYCFGCNVLIAGQRFYGEGIESSWKNGTLHDLAVVSDLYDHTVNRGLAFNRTLWNKIKTCEKIFCDTYKERNWDYALMEVSMGCMNSSRLKVLAPEAPRLFHVGDCGMHYHPNICNPMPGVGVIEKYIQQFRHALFPEDINLSLRFIKNKGGRRAADGYWSESDSKLCVRLGI